MTDREYPPTKDNAVWFLGPGGRKVCVDVLQEVEEKHRSVRVTVSSNKLKVYLEYLVRENVYQPTTGELENLLRTCGIRQGIDSESLNLIISFLKQGETYIGPVQVARGRPAQPGSDGRIDFIVNPSSEKARYKTDEEGNIDYRETNLIENALQGNDIAIVHPPTRGEEGVTVFGNPIPTSPGQPLSLRIGKNVELDESTGRCYATCDGRVVYEDKTISITDTYSINGDVDMSVGNIDFVGEVFISGQVLDDFNIRGKQGIHIRGTVEGSNLWSERDIAVDGGIAGKGRCKVISKGGSVNTKYLNDVVLEAEGDVIVNNEIVNSTINCNGTLRIPNGSLIGGETSTLSGIEAGSIGSNLGVSTRAYTGINWTAEKRRAELDTTLEEIDEHIDRLTASATPIARKAERIGILDRKSQNLLRDMLQQLRALQKRRNEVLAEQESIGDEIAQNAVFQINVNKKVYSGTTVKLGDIVSQIRNPLQGPLSIRPAKDGDNIQVIPQERLHKTGEDVELEM